MATGTGLVGAEPSLTTDVQQVGRVLLIAGSGDGVEQIRVWLVGIGYRVDVFGEAEAALSALGTLHPDAILLATYLPGLGGIETLARLRRSYARVPVVMLLSDASPKVISAMMQMGAYDFISTPVDQAKLLTVTRNAIERGRMALRLHQLEREAEGRGYEGLIGSSRVMKELFRQLDQIASSEVSILLLGESGTGKELVARSIHANSGRAAGPFVALNCAAIAETLQESELFGHEKGAFTGATARRSGKFEQASGGTLFLDEVAELSPSLQAKLLRALQERRFYRVGGDAEIRSDFRLVAASHRDLVNEVRAGRFREDLFFRIAVYELEIPPLRDRESDLMMLAEEFVRLYAPGRKLEFSTEVISLLQDYRWPGNVRELQNAMQRAAVSCTGGTIAAKDLPRTIRGGDRWGDSRPPYSPADSRPPYAPSDSRPPFASPDARTHAASDPGSAWSRGSGRAPLPWSPDASNVPGIWGNDQFGETPLPRFSAINTSNLAAVASNEGSDLIRLDELERQAIERAMQHAGGQVTEACRMLGISRATLYRKLEKFGLR